MKQFEYRVENIQIQMKNGVDLNISITEKLNSLGKEGWELSGVNGTIFYFKKEISSYST